VLRVPKWPVAGIRKARGLARRRKSLGLRKGREGAEKTITLFTYEDCMRKGDDNGNQGHRD
jgi:hypothetical protein